MKRTDIKKHSFQTMGIGPVGFDYSPLEKVLADVGAMLTIAHRHDYYEVIWFTEGSGRHFVEFAAHEVSPNTLLFLGRNQIHAFENVSGFKGHMLRFDEQFLGSGSQGSPAHTLFGSESCTLRSLSPAALETCAALINSIERETKTPGRLQHEQMLTHLLNAFLIEVARLEPETSQFSMERQRTMQQFQRFVSRLESRYTKEHRVEQYSELMAISTKRLNDICHSVAGMSAKKIIAERIMLEARRYLLHSELSVQEICFRLGFDDPAYFSRAFKKVIGQSPSDFRQHSEKSKHNLH